MLAKVAKQFVCRYLSWGEIKFMLIDIKPGCAYKIKNKEKKREPVNGTSSALGKVHVTYGCLFFKWPLKPN